MIEKIIKTLLVSVINWKTTLAGVITLVSSLGDFLLKLSVNVTALIDSDPTTVADFNAVKASFALVVLGFALVFAKDGDKSTEDVKKVL